ncbi:MAG TPA: PAS domain-containing protein [Rhodothermales bacterium]|nr:PAS domain-containing protein [Rhodothermales bacterium]
MDASALLDPGIAERLDQIFGQATDSMQALEKRAHDLLPGYNVIVWEGDAANFRSRFVSHSAVDVLGHPAESWISDPEFWPQKVVHQEDLEETLTNCALAIAHRSSCDLVFRALTADGRVVWMRDSIRVVVGPRRIATKLRGIMIEIPNEMATRRNEA